MHITSTSAPGSVSSRVRRHRATSLLVAFATVVCLLAGVARPAHAQAGTWQLHPNEVLHPGEALWSPSHGFALWMQTDGNLVLTGPSGPMWATGTSGHPNAFLGNQNDGNLVLYTPDVRPLWNSGTGGTTNPSLEGNTLELQDDGNLVLYRRGHVAIWASNTRGSNPPATNPPPTNPPPTNPPPTNPPPTNPPPTNPPRPPHVCVVPGIPVVPSNWKLKSTWGNCVSRAQARAFAGEFKKAIWYTAAACGIDTVSLGSIPGDALGWAGGQIFNALTAIGGGDDLCTIAVRVSKLTIKLWQLQNDAPYVRMRAYRVIRRLAPDACGAVVQVNGTAYSWKYIC